MLFGRISTEVIGSLHCSPISLIAHSYDWSLASIGHALHFTCKTRPRQSVPVVRDSDPPACIACAFIQCCFRMTLKGIGEVPVVDVHRNNFTNFWPSILFACKTASFIAIDAELSGLGPRKRLTEKDLNERYKAIGDVAKTRAVLSLGLSCYRYTPPAGQDVSELSPGFAVQTYNITTLCNEDYMVEPAALRFLLDHGFDFNKQYSEGILYHPGADKVSEGDNISVRSLFSEILGCGRPVVVHNGLVDMVFLYQHFYAPLPPTYAQFVVDLSEMFQGGLFDTKYLAEFTARFPSSYLEYVFRWCTMENCSRSRSDERCISLTFQEYTDRLYVEYHPVPLPREISGGGPGQKICGLYSAFGHCNKRACDESHDLDIILNRDFKQAEQRKKRKYRKRKPRRTAPPLSKEGKSEAVSNDGEGSILESENGEPPQKMGRRERKAEDRMAVCETAVDNGIPGEGDCPVHEEQGGNEKTLLGVGSVDSGSMHEIAVASGRSSCSGGGVTENGTRSEGGVESGSDQTIPGTDSLHPSSICEDDADLQRKSQNGTDRTAVSGRGDSSKSMDGRTDGGRSSRQHGSHRAGFDAFMTGYALACLINVHGKFPAEGEEGDRLLGGFGMSGQGNKLFLSGKDVPMLVAKSSYAKSSQAHREKMKKLKR